MKLALNKRFEYKDLPDMAEINSQVDKIAAETTIGETLFFKKHGVKTEAEFKKKAMIPVKMPATIIQYISMNIPMHKGPIPMIFFSTSRIRKMSLRPCT